MLLGELMLYRLLTSVFVSPLLVAVFAVVLVVSLKQLRVDVLLGFEFEVVPIIRTGLVLWVMVLEVAMLILPTALLVQEL